MQPQRTQRTQSEGTRSCPEISPCTFAESLSEDVDDIRIPLEANGAAAAGDEETSRYGGPSSDPVSRDNGGGVLRAEEWESVASVAREISAEIDRV